MEPRPATGDDYAAVARSLREQSGEANTLDRALELAVELITGCDEAAVSLIGRRGRIETLNAVGERARLADERQYDLGDGPCLNAIREHETTQVRDLGQERRWPQWTRYVHDDLGLRSALCFQLFTSDHGYGALNLYSRTIDAFDEADYATGLALAAHAAVALASRREIDNLTRSAHSRGTIGVALGVVMERYDLDQEAAFAFLRRVSSITNTKLYELAQHISTTRDVPLTHGSTSQDT